MSKTVNTGKRTCFILGSFCGLHFNFQAAFLITMWEQFSNYELGYVRLPCFIQVA